MNKLERAKRFLKETARPGLRVVSLALLAACAYASTLSSDLLVASNNVPFNVTGVFDASNTTLSGTINIDTSGTHGILGELLTVDSGATTFMFSALSTSSGFHSFGSTTYYYSAIFDDTVSSTQATLTMDIFLGGSSNFDGYTGGALCSDTQSLCNAQVSTFTTQTQTLQGMQQNVMTLSSSASPLPDLSSGSLSPSAPEPSTALLVLAGGALLSLRRRKHRD